jgi:hypothetical protein
LEEALETVDREEVRKKWDNEMTRMDKMRYNEKIRVEIDEHSRKSFIELLHDTEWCRTNLPTVEIIHKACIFEDAMALTMNKSFEIRKNHIYIAKLTLLKDKIDGIRDMNTMLYLHHIIFI